MMTLLHDDAASHCVTHNIISIWFSKFTKQVCKLELLQAFPGSLEESIYQVDLDQTQRIA